MISTGPLEIKLKASCRIELSTKIWLQIFFFFLSPILESNMLLSISAWHASINHLHKDESENISNRDSSFRLQVSSFTFSFINYQIVIHNVKNKSNLYKLPRRWPCSRTAAWCLFPWSFLTILAGTPSLNISLIIPSGSLHFPVWRLFCDNFVSSWWCTTISYVKSRKHPGYSFPNYAFSLAWSNSKTSACR